MRDGYDTFIHALCRKACAQIIYAQAERQSTQSSLKHSGRAGAKPRPVSAASIHATESVGDAFADIAAAFIEKLGRLSIRSAQLGGRSACNLIDVLHALEVMSPITNSSARDLARYAMFQEVPFPQEVPRFPVLPPTRKRPREVVVPASVDDGMEANGTRNERPYIEPWMPSLPSAHTYVATPVYIKPESAKRDAALLNRQRSRVEKSLAKLKESQAKTSKTDKEELRAAIANAAPGNPFLALPIVGNGRVLQDDDQAVDVRTVIEPAKLYPDDASEFNLPPPADIAEKATRDQKRARVERILAEAGGGTTAVGGHADVS